MEISGESDELNDLFGFDLNSTFTKDTREELGDVEVVESQHKLPKVRPNLLSSAVKLHLSPQDAKAENSSDANKYLK